MAPTLFNLFFNLVVETWRRQITGDGVTILYNPNSHLVGSGSIKFSTASCNEFGFADQDDTAILSTSKEKIVHAMNSLFSVTSRWGLTISVPYTKAMVVSRTDGMICTGAAITKVVEVVNEFEYRGIGAPVYSGSANR